CMPAAREEAEEGRRALPEPFEPDGTAAEAQIELDVLARNHTNETLTGRRDAEAPSWMRVEPPEIDVSLSAGGSRPYSFTLITPASRPRGTHPLHFRMDVEGRSYANGLMPVRMGVGSV